MNASTAMRSLQETYDERPAALRLRHYLGDGAGDAANNLAFSMTSMSLLMALDRRGHRSDSRK